MSWMMSSVNLAFPNRIGHLSPHATLCSRSCNLPSGPGDVQKRRGNNSVRANPRGQEMGLHGQPSQAVPAGRFGAFPVFTSIPIKPAFHALAGIPRAGFSQMFAYRERSLSTVLTGGVNLAHIVHQYCSWISPFRILDYATLILMRPCTRRFLHWSNEPC